MIVVLFVVFSTAIDSVIYGHGHWLGWLDVCAPNAMIISSSPWSTWPSIQIHREHLYNSLLSSSFPVLDGISSLPSTFFNVHFWWCFVWTICQEEYSCALGKCMQNNSLLNFSTYSKLKLLRSANVPLRKHLMWLAFNSLQVFVWRNKSIITIIISTTQNTYKSWTLTSPLKTAWGRALIWLPNKNLNKSKEPIEKKP